MKTLTLKNKQYTQRGFFDLGLSMALLAIFGGTASIITDHSKIETGYAEIKAETTLSRMPSEVASADASDE